MLPTWADICIGHDQSKLYFIAQAYAVYARFSLQFRDLHNVQVMFLTRVVSPKIFCHFQGRPSLSSTHGDKCAMDNQGDGIWD